MAHQRATRKSLLLGLEALPVGQLHAVVDRLRSAPIVDHLVLSVSRFMADRLHVGRGSRVAFHTCDPRVGVETSQVSLQLFIAPEHMLVGVGL